VYGAEFITCFLNNAIFIKFYLKSHVLPERLSRTTSGTRTSVWKHQRTEILHLLRRQWISF